uniref:Uncharacterized protein n=1 Tax=Gloeothece verrucosa (strain PCC 7822) TaxID=497965 RepID=E0U5C6_GLOV7|nr:conserved hypothetical protein [Gloeothece verrucosa PCC 7822]
MLSVAVVYYIVIAVLVFSFWLKVFMADTTTEKTDLMSWLVLIIGTSLWPLVLPFAYLEISNKVSRQRH